MKFRSKYYSRRGGPKNIYVLNLSSPRSCMGGWWKPKMAVYAFGRMSVVFQLSSMAGNLNT